MLLTKLQRSRAAMVTAARIRDDKAANEKLNARLADLNRLAGELQTLVEIITAIQNADFATHVLDANQRRDLMGCIESCGQKADDRTLTDSDIMALKSIMGTCQYAATAKWKEGTAVRAGDIYNSLNSLINLLPDRQAATALLKNLSVAKEKLPSSGSGVSHFKNDLAKAQTMIGSLDLTDPDVKRFITRVRMGQATLTDLNDHALQWLKANHLTGKLKISF